MFAQAGIDQQIVIRSCTNAQQDAVDCQCLTPGKGDFQTIVCRGNRLNLGFEMYLDPSFFQRVDAELTDFWCNATSHSAWR